MASTRAISSHSSEIIIRNNTGYIEGLLTTGKFYKILQLTAILFRHTAVRCSKIQNSKYAFYVKTADRKHQKEIETLHPELLASLPSKHGQKHQYDPMTLVTKVARDRAACVCRMWSKQATSEGRAVDAEGMNVI